MSEHNRIIQAEAWNELSEIYSAIVSTVIESDEFEEDDDYDIEDYIDWYDEEESKMVIEGIETAIEDEKKYYDYRDIQEFETELEEDILDDYTSYRHDLSRCLKDIPKKFSKKDASGIKQDFDTLNSLCEKFNIDISYELEEAEVCFDILDSRIITKIYTQKKGVIYEPKLIIEANQLLIQQINKFPELIYDVDPRKFEEIIAEIFYKMGFQVELTKATRDGGYDIVAISNNMEKYLIECKRYAKHKKISVGFVQRLLGIKISEKARKAILATTSTFTWPAYDFGLKNIWHLELKDYNDIMLWVNQYCQSL